MASARPGRSEAKVPGFVIDPAALLGVLAILLPLFVVVATRGLISANATVLGVQRAPAAGAASAVLGACMFGGGILVSPLLALGGEKPQRRWPPWLPVAQSRRCSRRRS